MKPKGRFLFSSFGMQMDLLNVGGPLVRVGRQAQSIQMPSCPSFLSPSPPLLSFDFLKTYFKIVWPNHSGVIYISY